MCIVLGDTVNKLGKTLVIYIRLKRNRQNNTRFERYVSVKNDLGELVFM